MLCKHFLEKSWLLPFINDESCLSTWVFADVPAGYIFIDDAQLNRVINFAGSLVKTDSCLTRLGTQPVIG
jgi:hypothetical protein